MKTEIVKFTMHNGLHKEKIVATKIKKNLWHMVGKQSSFHANNKAAKLFFEKYGVES